MVLKNCSTVLFVKNIEESKEFYMKVLGMTVQVDMVKNVIFTNSLAIWEIRADHIIPVTLGDDIMKGANRFELYFETEELEEICSQLRQNNVKLLHEKHEESWGQQTVRFFDPDDHLIEIGESMPQFIRRFHEKGLSPGEISIKTSVPEEDIRKMLAGH